MLKGGKSIGVRAWALAVLGLAFGSLLAVLIRLEPTKPDVLASSIQEVETVPQASAAAGGETYAWKRVAVGGGGFITGYDSDPAGRTRVVRADVYGAYIWRSDLDRWVQLVTSSTMPAEYRSQNGMNEGVFEIVTSPTRPDRIYMAAKGWVFRSDNQGRSFVDASRSLPTPLIFDPNSDFRNFGPYMAVSPADPDHILFGTPNDGLWRSTDAGETWGRVPSVPASADLQPEPGVQSPGTIIWFEPREGHPTKRIWAMSPGHGVYVSSDNGDSFEPLVGTGEPQPRLITQGAFAPDGTFFAVDRESRSLWRFRTGTWTNLTEHSWTLTGRFVAVAVNPATSDIFVFDEGGRVYRSSNGGENWWPLLHHSRVGEGDPPWLRVSNTSYFAMGRVQFDPVTPNRLWVGAGTGVYYADIPESVFSITWISQARGIEELVANDVIQPRGRSPLFAALDFGIHVKDDLDAYSTTYGPKERVLIAAQQLAWSPSNPDFVVTNASDTRTFCCSQDGDAVLAGYSLDGGRSWVKFASLPQPPGTKVDDPWRMSFGTIAVSSGDIDNIIWASSFNRSPYYTTDRGKTWTRVALTGERLPATGSHSSFYMQRKTLAADRVQTGVFYLVHSGEADNAGLTGLWRTRDGGAHWEHAFMGEIAPQSQYAAKLRAVPGHEGHLFFTSGVAEGSDTSLRRSRDGGSSWSIVHGIDHVDDVAFGKPAPGSPYPAIFISGRVLGHYGVWRSTDDAVTWKRVGTFPLGSLDQVTVLGADPDRFGRVYLGYKGSGWIYGEPARCTVAPHQFPNETECVGVD
ncbi:hypothetical protein KHP60_14100 [Microvirga sp. 3-52]|uniref:WD40/YVTN/BNR-like repeat-containing protein n=1 Tax=Microvirga sp. 3-52 TaxID=2792425 RepID=UPI001AC4119A|nr:sialidase family protein [Microvirga sp. 3-52]MBO1908988.1 hypothetical protein [Microvirga sp. 3-52]MBS7453461.1 hypothetical protein [Microvirga sp. 3-52]